MDSIIQPSNNRGQGYKSRISEVESPKTSKNDAGGRFSKLTDVFGRRTNGSNNNNLFASIARVTFLDIFSKLAHYHLPAAHSSLESVTKFGVLSVCCNKNKGFTSLPF